MPVIQGRLIATVAALTLISASDALAQEPGATDPSRGSPSGTIYEIPVEGGRQDGAPRDDARSRGTVAPATDSQTTSPIHSDNGFGTSSVVPGATATVTSASQAKRRKGDTRRAESRTRGPKKDTSPRPASESQISEGQKPVAATVSRAPSLPRSYLLLALGAILGLVLAVAARLAGRQR